METGARDQTSPVPSAERRERSPRSTPDAVSPSGTRCGAQKPEGSCNLKGSVPEGRTACRSVFTSPLGDPENRNGRPEGCGSIREGRRTGGIAQLVERQLCKLDVRSSNLLASTTAAFFAWQHEERAAGRERAGQGRRRQEGSKPCGRTPAG